MSEPGENETGDVDDTAALPQQSPAPKDDFGWYAFHERNVLLQLREPYMVVEVAPNGAHELALAPDKQGVQALPFISGTLFVQRSGTPSGLLLVVRVPIRNTTGFGLITMSPEDVLYCTHIVPPSKIIQPGT